MRSASRSTSPSRVYAAYSSVYGPQAYGRSQPKASPKPKPKPPPLHELEEKNEFLRKQVETMRQNLIDFNDEETMLKVKIAQLSGECGAKNQQAERLEQEADEIERTLAKQQRERGLEIASRREERGAWQHRIEQFAQAAAEATKQLADLQEEVASGVQERRQLQGECLSLQQECEDARVELQETRDILRETGNTLERMVKQKINLEWELQEQTQKQKVVEAVLKQAESGLAGEVEEAHRQRVDFVKRSRREIEHQRALAESFRCAAVADQREFGAVINEHRRLEREAAGYSEEMQRLEVRKRALDDETLQEHECQRLAQQVLDGTRKRREALESQLAQLDRKTQTSSAEVADLQEEQARFFLNNARRQAADVLERSPPALLGSFNQLPAAIPLPTSIAGAKPVVIPLTRAGSGVGVIVNSSPSRRSVPVGVTVDSSPSRRSVPVGVTVDSSPSRRSLPTL